MEVMDLQSGFGPQKRFIEDACSNVKETAVINERQDQSDGKDKYSHSFLASFSIFSINCPFFALYPSDREIFKVCRRKSLNCFHLYMFIFFGVFRMSDKKIPKQDLAFPV